MICTSGHTLCSGDEIKEDVMGVVCSTYADNRNLVGKMEGVNLLERSRSTWEDHIEDDFTYVGCEVVEIIYLAQDRVQWGVPVRKIMSFSCHKRTEFLVG
jgi:hypothetical protein